MSISSTVLDLSTVAGTQIVLIDDEQGVLRALTLVLEGFGCIVAPYTNSEDAVSKILKTEGLTDLVVSDFRMPKMSGLDVVSALRACGSLVPFILMSGHATTEDIEDAKNAGATAFIAKPFSPIQLIEQIVLLKMKKAA